MTTQQNKEIARDFFARFSAGVKGAIAEGDTVALEVESWGELDNGRSYNNEYHTLMRLADGKIVEVREYSDTQHAHDVWLRP